MTIPVYVLGCEELPARKTACLDHLRSVGVDPVWWRSIHGRTWGLETVREFDPGQRISPGHVGLLLGHWTLWNHLWNRPYLQREPHPDEWSGIVLEDDVVVPQDFAAQTWKVISEVIEHVPDADFVFLGLAEPDGPRVWNKITERIGPPGSRLCRLEWPWGTHAYMVRRRALPVLLDNMAVAERNIDQQLYSRVLSKGLLNWCAVLPSLVRQRTYDHDGTGTPEWAPSTISDADGPNRDSTQAAVLRAAEQARDYALLRQRPYEQSPETVAASLLMTDPHPCIYRGENLEIVGSVGNRSIPLDLCANLNRPCYSRPVKTPVSYRDDLGRQQLAVDCGACDLRREMAPAERVRPRLPLPEGHFNPSMAVYRGETILATRDSWGHSKVALWRLRHSLPDWGARVETVSLAHKGGPDVQHITYDEGEWSCEAISSVGSDHPEAPRLEDPRLFTMPWPTPDSERRLCSMFNLPDGYPPKLVQVGYGVFSEDLTRIEHFEVFKSPPGNLYEKNWTPFWDPNVRELKWSYAWKPDHVVLRGDCALDGQAEWSQNHLPWTGGVIRGGAAPVRVDLGDEDLLYYFFHGALKRPQGTIYTVGCLVTEGRPPYRVLRQTPTPLIWPDLPALDETVVKRYVVWPGGAVLAYGSWWLALGIDDTYCRIHRLSIQEVDAALRDVPESESERTTSIRDTAIALGIKPD